jgi:hypothetical protein
MMMLTDGSGLHPVSERIKIWYVGGASSKCPRSCVDPVLSCLGSGVHFIEMGSLGLDWNKNTALDSNIAYRVRGRHSLDPLPGGEGACREDVLRLVSH